MTRALNIAELSGNDGWQVAASKINYNFKSLYSSLSSNSSSSNGEVENRLKQAIADLSADVSRRFIDVEEEMAEVRDDVANNSDAIDDINERLDDLDIPDAFDPTEINERLDSIDGEINTINQVDSQQTMRLSRIEDDVDALESDYQTFSMNTINQFMDIREALTEINNKLDNLEIPDPVPSVGTIIMYADDTDPNEVYEGTTWELMPDVFLLGAGNKYELGATGGEESHTLSSTEIPSHRHMLNIANTNSEASGYGLTITGGFANRVMIERANNTWSSLTGGGQAHNNMPPYEAVNIWKRTA